MNTLVSYQIKELLYSKGWEYSLSTTKENRVSNSLAEQRWNEGDLSYVDINVFEVVTWLYERHGIWIQSFPHDTITAAKEWVATILSLQWGEDKEIHNEYKIGGCKSPTEAYEAAIDYVLNNLL
jgi:hypothetical protein